MPHPPIDAELQAALESNPFPLPGDFTLEQMIATRQAPGERVPADPALTTKIVRTDQRILGHDGGEIEIAVFQAIDHATPGPVILHIHGGGMVMGAPEWGVNNFTDRIAADEVTVVSVAYRLAPEHPDPYPVRDSYAALLWTVAHAAELAVDPTRVVVAGESAGGGIAAGVALLARDENGPALLAQLLTYPMLDDRDDTVSSRQYEQVGTWRRGSNRVGWTALLGDRTAGSDVSAYAAPARANDFTELPPAYIEVGSAEVFRDEDVAYATALWAAGVQAELHVWAGGFHGFDGFAPDAAVTRAAVAARRSWLDRTLATDTRAPAAPRG